MNRVQHKYEHQDHPIAIPKMKSINYKDRTGYTQPHIKFRNSTQGKKLLTKCINNDYAANRQRLICSPKKGQRLIKAFLSRRFIFLFFFPKHIFLFSGIFCTLLWGYDNNYIWSQTILLLHILIVERITTSQLASINKLDCGIWKTSCFEWYRPPYSFRKQNILF